MKLRLWDDTGLQTKDGDIASDKGQSDGHLYESSVLITEKGSLKWLRDYRNLCQVVDQLQLQPGKWTSPGGYCKLFENGEVSIRWYSNNRTLTLKGE